MKAEGLKFAIVCSRFNEFFVSKLLGGALDTIVRHGGDKFAMVQVLGSGEDIAGVTAEIHAKLQQVSSAVACTVEVSIGLAVYKGAAVETLQDFIARADKEMYAEKALKRAQRT